MDMDLEEPETAYAETSEDILAKYRRKVSTSSEATASDSTTGSRHSSSIKSKNSTDSDCRSHTGDLINSADELFHFNNAKKKLRIVLASSELYSIDFRHIYVSIEWDLEKELFYRRLEVQ